MQDSLSCLYVDWSAIGTWVGGIGTIGAVCTALSLARKDEKRRARYAEYLLQRDVLLVRPFVGLLREAAEGQLEIHNLYRSSENPVEKEGFYNGFLITLFKELAKIRGRFEIFGAAGRMFDLDIDGAVVTELEDAVLDLLKVDEIVKEIEELGFGHEGVGEELIKISDALNNALNKLPVD